MTSRVQSAHGLATIAAVRRGKQMVAGNGPFHRLAVATMLALSGCASSRDGLGFSTCNAYLFAKEASAADVLHEVQKLTETAGVAMVEDHRLNGLGFLIVHCRPGADAAVRLAVADAGYRSVAGIPAEAVPGSHTFGRVAPFAVHARVAPGIPPVPAPGDAQIRDGSPAREP